MGVDDVLRYSSTPIFFFLYVQCKERLQIMDIVKQLDVLHL